MVHEFLSGGSGEAGAARSPECYQGQTQVPVTTSVTVKSMKTSVCVIFQFFLYFLMEMTEIGLSWAVW